MSNFLRQTFLVLKQGLTVEWADPRRLVAPMLFAATFVILFSFALGEVDKAWAKQVFVAQIYLTLFFTLEIVFSRIFEPDQEDRVFELLRTYPLGSHAWYLGRYLLAMVLGTLVAFPTILLVALFQGKVDVWGQALAIFGIPLASLSGLASLGVLLSTMTMRAQARQLLYPLLYFPLVMPVLLSGVQASLDIMGSAELSKMAYNWVGLLLGFDVIYLTLSLLLFGELVENG